VIPPALPTACELQTQLDKLEASPGSVLLIAIELPSNQNYCRTTWAWLSAAERQTLKRSLTTARKKRGEAKL